MAAVWVLAHPYVGIARDAILYIGRAVADLNPDVGRQLDFAHDGQSGFTVFRPLARLMVAALGPGAAGKALTAAGLAAWIAAAAFLMSRFAKGPALWAALIAMAVMPADYGALGVYRYAEALATPRLLAETLSLAGLGLLFRRRRIAALALMAAAAALHPLIALPVWAVALVLLGMEDRRWLLVGAAAGVGALTAAALGAPVAGRLFQGFDPAWRAVVALRTAPVFVSLWDGETWALITCQFTTALLGAFTAERGLKTLLLATAGVAAAAIAASLIPSLLITQLQPWRAGWLLAALAAAALPMAAAALWGRGAAGRAALGLLAIAWLGRGSLALSAPAALAALAGGLWPSVRPFPRLALIGLWAAAAGLALGTEGVRLAAAASVYAADRRISLTPLLLSGLPASILAAIAAAVAIRAVAIRPPAPGSRRLGAAALAGAFVALAAGLLLWDDRPPFTRWAENGARNPPLRSLLRSGSVYWLGYYAETWLVTGLPEWWSGNEGGGVVFDRPQAMKWARLRTIARASGFAFPHDSVGSVSPPALDRLCRAHGDPDWVIAPAAAVADPALYAQATPWRAGAAQRLDAADGKSPVIVRDYAIFSCADVRGWALASGAPKQPTVPVAH